jgi:ABC-type multidrug transport system fused ATPase/permease subunit
MPENKTAWAVVRDGATLSWRFITTHPASFALGVLGAALFAIAIIAASLVVGWVTDTVIIPVLDRGVDPAGMLLGTVAAIVGVSVFKAAGIVLRRTAAGWLQFRVRQDVRNQLLDHQLRLEMSWFNRQAVGDLLAVADSDVNQGTGVLGPLPFATGVLFLLVGTVIMVTLIDPWLALAAVVGLTLVVVIDIHGSWVTYSKWEDVQRYRGEVSSVAHESFDGALTVKALGREGFVAERFGRVSDGLRDRLIDVNSTWIKYQVVIKALPQMIIVILLVAGAARIDSGAITAGDLVTVAYLLSLLAFPVQVIGFVLWALAGSLAGWQRVQAVLDVDDYVTYGEERGEAAAGPASVDGRSLSFAYDGSPVLKDASLRISAGTTVAVVGPTGSGKSTLCVLLARLWDPDTGEIRIEGRDLRSFARSELAKEVAFVSQNPFLFDATVRENITLGVEVDDTEVEAALALAGAEGFVAELPQGLETPIGERGTALSGGERQRIALARALLRKPRLLVLDDATSAVDPSVETRILLGLRQASLPSTVVIVAYRPSSISLADEVLYVDEGRIAGHGTHAELLRSTPGYARLVQAYEQEADRLREEAS